MNKWLEVLNKFNNKDWATATVLGTTGATCSALVKRGLLEARNCSPKIYHITSKGQKYIKVVPLFTNKEFVTLKRSKERLGMMCYMDNNNVVDCYGNPYDLTEVDLYAIHQEGEVKYVEI